MKTHKLVHIKLVRYEHVTLVCVSMVRLREVQLDIVGHFISLC